MFIRGSTRDTRDALYISFRLTRALELIRLSEIERDLFRKREKGDTTACLPPFLPKLVAERAGRPAYAWKGLPTSSPIAQHSVLLLLFPQLSILDCPVHLVRLFGAVVHSLHNLTSTYLSHRLIPDNAGKRSQW